MRPNKYLLIHIVFLCFLSCQYTPKDRILENVISSAKAHNVDLNQVLEHYSQDTLKLEAAKFLIRNLPGNVSYDSSKLGKYRPILYKLDSLRQLRTMSERDLLDQTDSDWDKLYGNHFSPSDVYAKLKEDLLAISPNYLIDNIDQAFGIWQQSPFKDSVDFHTFMRYLLPYRKQNGYIIEPWRAYFLSNYGQYQNRYPSIRQTTDYLMELVKDYQVDWRKISDYPFICLNDYNLAKMSRCTHKCWFNSMLLCALGIPCTIDFVPAWGNRNHSHEWNAIIINGKTYPFEATGGEGMWHNQLVYNNVWIDKYWMKSRLPKVLRYSYESAKNGPSADKECNSKNTPIRFLNSKYEDVSPEYFKTSDIRIPIKGKGIFAKTPKYAYLCVFNEDRWQPVYWGKTKRGNACFEKMGRDIVYLPVFYENGEITPFNDAFILQQDGTIHYLTPNMKTETSALLKRKYYARPDIEFWKEWNIGGYFEVSDDESFLNAQKIFTVTTCESTPNTWILESPVTTRYIRYVFPQKIDVLAELYFFKKDKQANTLVRIDGNRIFPHKTDVIEMEKLFDGDLLSYADLTKRPQSDHQKSPWVGIDLMEKAEIAAIGICPRNDKNNIIKDLEYELYYWNNRWVSLGRKTATDYHITYDHIPENSLLYLKCTSEGNENRIFTWQGNGPKWW